MKLICVTVMVIISIMGTRALGTDELVNLSTEKLLLTWINTLAEYIVVDETGRQLQKVQCKYNV